MEEAQVREELRQLRFLNRSIDTALQVKKNHEERLLALREREQTEEIKSIIGRIEASLKIFDITEEIRKAAELEMRYMKVIERLDRLDRIILLDGYINGTPYWRVGKKIGYSERGVQRRLANIIRRIANML